VVVSAVVGIEGQFAEGLRGARADVYTAGSDIETAGVNGFFRAVDVFLKCQPDVVHFNGGESMALWHAAALMCAPLVIHARNGIMGPLERQAKDADAVIAVSHYVARQLVSCGVASERVSVVYNGLDLDSFRPSWKSLEDARAVLSLPSRVPVVLMVARFDEDKNHADVLTALAQIKDKSGHNDLTLLLVGEAFDGGSTMAAVMAMAATLGLEENIAYRPYLEDIRWAYAASDVLVLASRNEGMATCVVEAMAMGVPVAVTDGSGSHELIQHEVSGLVVPSSDTAGLALALQRMLCDNSLRLRCAREARLAAERHLDIVASSAEVDAVYQRVSDERREASACV